MGKVYLAEDSAIDRQVAIKVIREELNTQGGEGQRNEVTRLFLREARAIAKLNHPHILPLFDFGEDEQAQVRRIFMVMPYCQDGSLHEWLQQRGTNLPTPQEVSYMVDQAADALQYAHEQQIIHQDVKPHNFLIRKARHAEIPDLLLTDFGIAKVAAINPEMSYAIRGTPAYMAPEQWQGHPVPATDQYGLAATAYQLLTGRQVFQGNQGSVMYQHMMVEPQPPSAFNPQITPEIDAVLLRALAKKPEERYPSVSAFAQALKDAVKKLDSYATRSAQTMAPMQRVGDTLNVSLPSLSYTPASQAMPPSYNPSSQPGYPASLPSQPVAAPGYVPTPVRLAANQVTYAQPGTGYTPPSQPAPSVPPRRTNPLVIALIVLLILLLIGTSTFIATMLLTSHNNDTNAKATAQAGTATMQASGSTAAATNATSTAQARATALAQPIIDPTQAAQATATAGAQGTATAQASATALAVNPYAPNTGTLAFYDSLQSNTQGWEEYTHNESACKFVGGALHAFETVKEFYTNCLAKPTFKNFTLEVQMAIIQGDCGGIMFRMDDTHAKFYYFRVCTDGGYACYLFTDNNSAHAQKLADGTSAAFNTGLNQQNTIAVVAASDSITMYINQTSLGSVANAQYTQGLIAVVAGDRGNTTEVVFKDVRVWQQ